MSGAIDFEFMMDDTIAAVSTPPGEGGIGIVRISGSLALEAARSLFRFRGGKNQNIEPRRVHYGHIIDPKSGEKIDEVILTYMKAPRSYTTQDVIEINCHGGPVILRRILETVVSSFDIRLAEPGEFTKRAFLGGRIDLAQAEAVMDLISARTDKARKVAYNQLSGNLSRLLDELREDLIDFMLQLEVRIDFCEDDIPPLEEDYKEERINRVLSEIGVILESFEGGRILREGVRACIIGPPNVGKSTLMNTLLDEERAIVTHVPGTTRDRIEEMINLKGVPVVLIDTAGIRESEDLVESIGIKRSIEAAGSADLVLLVLDASSEDLPDPVEFIGGLAPERVMAVMNKTDLGRNYPREFMEGFFPSKRIVEVSLKNRNNVEELEGAMLDLIFEGKSGSASELILSNVRHRDALVKTRSSLLHAKESIGQGLPDDFITIDLNAALDSLGEITGRVVYEDLMDRVFNNFCIGK